jgi:hypothetical protein
MQGHLVLMFSCMDCLLEDPKSTFFSFFNLDCSAVPKIALGNAQMYDHALLMDTREECLRMLVVCMQMSRIRHLAIVHIYKFHFHTCFTMVFTKIQNLESEIILSISLSHKSIPTKCFVYSEITGISFHTKTLFNSKKTF